MKVLLQNILALKDMHNTSDFSFNDFDMYKHLGINVECKCCDVCAVVYECDACKI